MQPRDHVVVVVISMLLVCRHGPRGAWWWGMVVWHVVCGLACGLACAALQLPFRRTDICFFYRAGMYNIFLSPVPSLIRGYYRTSNSVAQPFDKYIMGIA